MEIALKVSSFNVKNNLFNIGKHAWHYRVLPIAELISLQSPDILGTQELTYPALLELQSSLPGYGWCGQGRSGGHNGEHTAIFYKRDLFDLESTRTFWLSKRPHTPGSRSWFSLFPRICTVAVLRHKRSKEVLAVYNTHLDHVSPAARKNGLMLIREQMLSDRNRWHCPVVFMGDFNATPESYAIGAFESSCEKLLLTSGYRQLFDEGCAIGRTYHGFHGGVKGLPIDHIFISPELAVEKVMLDRSRLSERYPSDHYPVIAELVWQITVGSTLTA